MSCFCPEKDHPISFLQKICDKWILVEETKDKINFLTRELEIMDIIIILGIECIIMPDHVMKKIRHLFQYVAAQLVQVNKPGDANHAIDLMFSEILTTRSFIKMHSNFNKTSLPLHNAAAAATATDPKFVKKFIDAVVARNLFDPEAVKELKFLQIFLNFISDLRCTNPQIQHPFFTHVLVECSLAAMAVWLDSPDYKGCFRKICVDFVQALKSGWPMEYVADCEASFVETLIHCLEELPIISRKVCLEEFPFISRKVSALDQDQKATLHDILLRANINLRANLNLRADLMGLAILKVHLQDIDRIVDAGLLVSLLYDNVEEKEDVVLDFLGHIHSLQSEIYLFIRKSFQSKLPKIEGLRSIDIILDNMKEFLRYYPDSLADHIKSQVQTIQVELEQFQKQLIGEYQLFAMQVTPKVHEVEQIVVAYINKDIPEWVLVRWIGDIVGEITVLTREVAGIYENKVAQLVLHNTKDVPSVHTSQFARITSMKGEVIGLEEVMDNLRQKLIRGSPKLDVISIVGMPGSGKTTLANKLYHDQSVVSRFDVRADCCVSQVYTRKDLLLAILHGLNKDMTISDKLPENELADKLRKLLLVKRYLILVDDVWETSAWDDLKPCFPDANSGSRIILTTRHVDVASHAKLDSDPLSLRSLTHKESWMLLKKKVFNENCCPAVLEDVGQKIAQKCGGLPLSVVLVAGILETMEKEKHCWERVALDLGAHIQDKSEVVIELSYKHLPYHLKPCFLYFGVFMEDESIQVSKLAWLWTAEGLVNNHLDKLPEDTAEYYLKNLIGRNLLMVAKKSSDGKIKACRIHDLVHDFCRKKANDENFLKWIEGRRVISLHQFQGRLSLCSQGDNLPECWSICSPVTSFRFRESRNIVLSSINRASIIFKRFKFLRVLDLELTLVDSFPEALTFLRYVAMRIIEGSSLSFLGNLWNVETLIVKGIGGKVSLPHTLWNMAKLRHLHIYKYAIFVSESTKEMVNLQTLSSAQFSSVDDADNILAKTPNLRKLRCEVSELNGAFPAFDKLEKLEMLKFSFGRPLIRVTQLNFPQNLKKLTLSDGCIQSLDEVATLPRLEVLKLLGVTINSNAWEVTDEQFPQLKFLKLQSPSFSKWNVSEDAFLCLEHLVFKRCRHLEEIPSRFEDASSLKSVEIISCNKALAESAMAVRETCTEISGSSGFEVFIHK